jgi:hypothetical protein
VSQGYWGSDWPSCRCCHSGPKEKYWCRECDHVCKAPLAWTPLCPRCRQKMENMGHRWRPGKKGKRKDTPKSTHGRATRFGQKLGDKGRIKAYWIP